MKLSAKQHATLTGDSDQLLQWALWWAEQGWPVFPLRPGAKTPLFPKARHVAAQAKCTGACGQIGHGVHDATLDPQTIRLWWTENPNAGIGGATTGRVVIDLDLQNGADLSPLPALLPATRVHWSGRRNGNRHLVYRADPGLRVRPKNNALGPGIDVKAGPGAYVVLPPTRHEDTGLAYYVQDDDDECTLTAAQWRQLGGTSLSVVEGAGTGTGESSPAAAAAAILGAAGARGNGSRMLNELLARPAHQGSRNQWLTEVAGHYARQYRRAEDLYRTHVQQAAALLHSPLDQAEVDKVLDSIWRTEQAGHPERDCTEETGYMVGNGQALAVRCRANGNDTIERIADFDVTARGVALDPQQQRTYWLTLHTREGDIEATVDGKILGERRATERWLAAYGQSWVMPPHEFPKVPPHVRLLRYIEQQRPQPVRLIEQLGWVPALGGYLVPGGMITADGLVANQQIGACASPALVKEAGYRYGFSGTEQEALGVLRQVLTFQDPQVTAVFGAWWAAVLLKEQIREHTSLFPFVSVEAASGAGKTNGFFNLMVQLNGSIRGESTMTRAVTRTIASYNRNGVAWIDDMDHLGTIVEVLRAATSGGSMSKMDVDHRGAASIQLVSAILVTGEHIGFENEKALADRNISLSAPSPVGRMSQLPGRGDRPQWEDVVELQQRFPESQGGLAQLSGWLLQRMAQAIRGQLVAGWVQQAGADPARRRGRNGDKDLALLVGARALDWLVSGEPADELPADGPTLPVVRSWIAGAAQNGTTEQDNALTLRVLPTLLRHTGFQSQVVRGEARDGYAYTPVVLRTGDRDAVRALAKALLGEATPEDHHALAQAGDIQVRYHIPEVAQAWRRLMGSSVVERTDSEASLRAQSKVVGAGFARQRVTGGVRVPPLQYRTLDAATSRLVLQRALDEGRSL